MGSYYSPGLPGVPTLVAPRAMLAGEGHIAYYRLSPVSRWHHVNNLPHMMRRGNDADGPPVSSHAVRRTPGCSILWKVCTRGPSLNLSQFVEAGRVPLSCG